MNYKEALEWLKGKRSMCNTILDPSECAEVDAGMTQQAYWIARAYKDGIIEEEVNE